MSTHEYSRDLVDGRWDICMRQLPAQIEAVLPGKVFTLSASGSALSAIFADALTAGEIDTLDGTVAAHKAAFSALPQAKAEKISAIDSRTADLIGLGFTFGGKQFSLSMAAQSKIMGSHQIRDDVNFTYPVEWNTIDDADKLSIADSATLHGFYLTALGTMRTRLDSGTVLKQQVRDAVDLAGVAAVVDNR